MKPIRWLLVWVSHLVVFRSWSVSSLECRAWSFLRRHKVLLRLPSARNSTRLRCRHSAATTVVVDDITTPTPESEAPKSSSSNYSPIRSHLSVRICNMTSPRAWLEAQEDGAYSVLRCDFCPASASTPLSGASWSSSSLASNWRVWGLDFHMNRLCDSYSLFLRTTETERSQATAIATASDFDAARRLTLAMIEVLLLSQSDLETRIMAAEGNQDGSGRSTATLMVTVLWKPRINHSMTDGDSRSAWPPIDVTTHATHVSTTHPAPIHAVLALEESIPSVDRTTSDGADVNFFSPLPNRLPFPNAKLSRWCRERRPLEQRFQINDETRRTCEIFLCGQDGLPPEAGWTDHGGVVAPFPPRRTVELWEGLTTNVFVLYRDGVLRTAPSDRVLSGYVRHLVIQAAAQGGLVEGPVEERAPLVEEADRWDEVFVTSSVQLVVPVQSVCVVNDGVRVPVWTCARSYRTSSRLEEENGSDLRNSDPANDSLWKKIYDALLQSMLHTVIPIQ